MAAERDNIALKLADWLDQDRNNRRFSVISFDRDTKANERTIGRLVKQGRVIGHISASKPDFELANFTAAELKHIVILMDREGKDNSEALEKADLTGINSGKSFERWYGNYSLRGGKLKGAAWGEALAAFALDNPLHPDTQQERPFIRDLRLVIGARSYNYDLAANESTFDPVTFERVRRSPTAEQI